MSAAPRRRADAPAPPVVHPLPVRVEQLDDDGDEGDNDTVDEDEARLVDDNTVDGVRLVDDDAVDEFIAAFEGVAPLVRSFLARGPGDYLAEVLLDAADYERVMRGPAWRLHQVNYGKPGPARYYVRGGAGEYLHRVVMAAELASWTEPGRAVVDHINGNPLNNRRCNLRVVTYSQNNSNSRKVSSTTSSRFKVMTLKRGCRWRALIYKQGLKVHLGTFDSEEDSARAYDDAARTEFGEFACLNYAREGQRSALPPQPADESQPADE